MWAGRQTTACTPDSLACMNWQRIEGGWTHFKHNVKAQWGELTDDRIDLRLYIRDDRPAVLCTMLDFHQPERTAK